MQNKRRKYFLGDVARGAGHDVGTRNAIHIFLLTQGVLRVPLVMTLTSGGRNAIEILNNPSRC